MRPRRKNLATDVARLAIYRGIVPTLVPARLVERAELPGAAVQVDTLAEAAKNVTNVARWGILPVTAPKEEAVAADMEALMDRTKADMEAEGVMQAAGAVKAKRATPVEGMVTCPAIAPKARNVITVSFSRIFRQIK